MTQEPRPTPDMTPERMEQISERHRDINSWSATPELLPCPFCGGKSILHEDSFTSRAWVACNLCCAEGATIMFESTNDARQMRAAAISAWNTRTARTLTPEQVERAKRLLGDPCVEWNTVLWKVEAVDLLREVVGDE